MNPHIQGRVFYVDEPMQKPDSAEEIGWWFELLENDSMFLLKGPYPTAQKAAEVMQKALVSECSVKNNFPHLWAFFEGAIQANSGGHAIEEMFKEFSHKQMAQANKELGELHISPRELGGLADDGYTLHMPKDGEDECGPLLAFALLNTIY